MSDGKIVVIGSSNTDMVIYTDHIPKPGETVLGGKFKMNPGGKGANQAVAAARLGGSVTFITSIGDDVFGKESLENFESSNIDLSHINVQDGVPSGTALIMVDSNGENLISVASGANSYLSVDNISNTRDVIRKASFLLIQLEIPMQAVSHSLKIAKEENCPVILNPAPAQALSDEDLNSVYLITPNESEATILTGVDVNDHESARKAAIILRSKGVQNIIITLGEKGAFIYSDLLDEIVPSINVTAIDTTAAGDTFNGALAVALSEKKSLVDATKFANHAAALSVTKEGAQSSVPFRNELTIS